MYTADAEMAALKQRLKQLETALKAKDREVEKTRSVFSCSALQGIEIECLLPGMEVPCRDTG